jgi:hypothetical protein
MPSLTIREYNGSSGALLGNVSSLNFGRVTAGVTSAVKVIDVAFTEVTNIANIRIGLISSGGLTVNESPTNIAADGSASNGHFGCESGSVFDSSKSASGLSRHFAGLNTSGTASDSNNISIGNRTTTISNYIYLDIEMSSTVIGAGNGSYKLFFDYN